MKRLLLFLLLIVMLFTACSESPEEKSSTTASSDPPSIQESTQESTAPPTEPTPDYPANYLLSDVDNGDSFMAENNFVLGNMELQRVDICSITFLDSLTTAPESAWDASEEQNRSVLAWVEGDSLFVAGEGGVTAPPNSAFLFANYDNLQSIDFGGCFYTDRVYTMESMFSYCEYLTQLDLSNWNVENVENFESLFSGCEGLETIHMNGWSDNTLATDVSGMFYGCYSLKEVDISWLKGGNITNMNQMFMRCEALTELDLSELDVSTVTRMACTFYSCKSLSRLTLTNWQPQSLTDCHGMFQDCVNLTELSPAFEIPAGCNTDEMFDGSGLSA